MPVDENLYAAPRTDERSVGVRSSSIGDLRGLVVIQYVLVAGVLVLFFGSVVHFVATRSWRSFVLGGLLISFVAQWYRGRRLWNR